MPSSFGKFASVRTGSRDGGKRPGKTEVEPSPGPNAVLLADNVESERAVNLLRRGEFSKITHADVVDIFKAYSKAFGKNTDEDLSLKEIEHLLEIGVKEIDMQKYIKQMLYAGDKDNDGKITITEFHQALKLGAANEVEDLLRVMRGEKVNNNECSGEILTEYLETRIKTNENCVSLPFYILFFGIIWVLTVVHLQVDSTHRQNLALKAVLLDRPKVNSLVWKSEDDFWDWAHSYVIPTLFGSDPKGRLTFNNQVVGGLLLERYNAETESCLPRKYEALYGDGPTATCYGALEDNGAADAFWLPLKDFPARHQAEMHKLRTNGWLSGATKSVVVSLISYNGPKGFLTFSRLDFTVENGGRWVLTQEFESFSADPYDSDGAQFGLLIFLDILFLGMASVMFVLEVRKLWQLKRSNLGFKKAFLAEYTQFWNVIEWVNIIQSFACVIHWGVDVSRSNGVVEDLLAFKQSSPNPGDPGFYDAPVALYTRAYHAALSYKALRWYVTIFTITSMLRFFKAFRANARLNIVTRTIVVAGKDLAHFAIVFLSIFFAFVLMGHLMFGPRVYHFAKLATACDSCVMMLVGFLLDDVRSEMLKNTGSTGVAWIYLFIVIMQLLLVNMILVVIFDVYAEVKGNVNNAPTLYQQAIEVAVQKRDQVIRIREAKASLDNRMTKLTRAMSRGSLEAAELEAANGSPSPANGSPFSRAESNEELEKMMHELPDSQILFDLKNLLNDNNDDNNSWNEDLLCSKIAGLSKDQAQALIKNAKRFERDEEGDPGQSISLYDSIRLIARVDANVRELMQHHQSKDPRAAPKSPRSPTAVKRKLDSILLDAQHEDAWQVHTSEVNGHGNDKFPSTLPEVPEDSQGPPYHGFRAARIVE